MSLSQIKECRQPITTECFRETYETTSDLDFWSFVFWLPSVVFCWFESDFSYEVCTTNNAYVMNLKYLQDEMGIAY